MNSQKWRYLIIEIFIEGVLSKKKRKQLKNNWIFIFLPNLVRQMRGYVVYVESFRT